MRDWPWFSIVLALALLLNPLGLDVLYSALVSSEALARNIWLPIVLITAMLLLVLAIAEWFFRRLRRNRRMTAPASDRSGA